MSDEKTEGVTVQGVQLTDEDIAELAEAAGVSPSEMRRRMLRRLKAGEGVAEVGDAPAPGAPFVVGSPQGTAWLATRVHPHADELAKIFADGGIAVIVYEPDEYSAGIAKMLGWTGGDPRVFRMSAPGRRKLIEASRATGDDFQAADCLARKSGQRVFILDGDGSFLLHHSGTGWVLDRESRS